MGMEFDRLKLNCQDCGGERASQLCSPASKGVANEGEQ